MPAPPVLRSSLSRRRGRPCLCAPRGASAAVPLSARYARKLVYRSSQSGELRVLFTVDLFNEGVDIPCVDLVLFLRPTESMVVFLQQLGRGLRLHDGKQHLTVLDFLGNYRRAHYKLPFLVGAQDEDAASARKALQLLQQWQQGVRPEEVPEGVSVELESLALDALRQSLQAASPLRELVLDDLRGLREHLGRAPTLLEAYQFGRYSPKACLRALRKNRWHEVRVECGWASEEDQALDAQVGAFLAEVERTAMTKSFKMVVLLALLQDGRFAPAVSLPQLVGTFRRYFEAERHRLDVNGTPVEDVHGAPDAAWEDYLIRNPINAWTGGNATQPRDAFFAFDRAERQLRYIGPLPENRELFARALHERVAYRLADYWGEPAPGKFVFPAIPNGGGLCVMFGDGAGRRGLPEAGWHPVRINGRFLYGKFAKIALNVLKERPEETRSVPNLIDAELRRLLGIQGEEGARRRLRVRLVSLPAESSWAIEAA